jgi:hypothetical protein
MLVPGWNSRQRWRRRNSAAPVRNLVEVVLAFVGYKVLVVSRIPDEVQFLSALGVDRKSVV